MSARKSTPQLQRELRTARLQGAGLTVQKLAWMAGVLDLKGRFVKKNNQLRATPQMVLAVESKQHEVVRGLAEMTGTNPETRPNKEPPDWMRRGCREHCPEKHFHVEPYEWRMPGVTTWTITGASAAVVLYNVMPYMRTDRGLSETVAEIFANITTSGQGWGATRKSLRRLRNLGWEMPPELAKLNLDDTEDESTEQKVPA